MTTNICQHCGKEKCILDKAFLNVESYGDNTFKIRCVHCGKPILARLRRIAIVDSVYKSDRDDNDFGQ